MWIQHSCLHEMLSKFVCWVSIFRIRKCYNDCLIRPDQTKFASSGPDMQKKISIPKHDWHTYTHTYIHAYIHACMHTYIHTYIRCKMKHYSTKPSVCCTIWCMLSKQRAMYSTRKWSNRKNAHYMQLHNMQQHHLCPARSADLDLDTQEER